MRSVGVWEVMAHIGRMFIHGGPQSVANNASYDHMLVTPASEVDLVEFTIEIDGAPFTVWLYEDTVVSAYGTAQTFANLSRVSANTNQTLLFHSPTVTSVGTIVRHKIVPGTGAGGGVGESGNSHIRLKPNTNYLLRMTNNSGASRNTGVTIKICEGAIF